MKNNSKNRKLKYIRQKNIWRIGPVPIVFTFKVSGIFLREDIDTDKLVVLKIREQLDKFRLKYFILNNRLIKVEKGWDGDGFAKDLITIKATITKI